MAVAGRHVLGALSTRSYSTTRVCLAASAFKMPSMSPTMEQGGIGEWKVKEGDKFAAGDVLLTIETDKAEVDVEAQEDGVLGRIFRKNGESGITVGDTIAAIGESEDDDFSSIVPGSAATSSTTTATPQTPSQTSSQESQKTDQQGHVVKHSKPLLPSVLLLLEKAGIFDAGKIRGSGVRGMLTKGDVLAFLGKTTNPLGSASKLKPVSIIPANVSSSSSSSSSPSSSSQLRDATASEFRRLITQGLALPRNKNRFVETETLSYDAIVDEYLAANGTQTRIEQPARHQKAFDEFVGL